MVRLLKEASFQNSPYLLKISNAEKNRIFAVILFGTFKNVIG